MKKILILFYLIFTLVFCFSQNWNSIGPPTQPTSLCVSASNNYILIGTQQTGVARSIDSGRTWSYTQGIPIPQKMFAGSLPSYVVMCLQQDPSNHQIIYAGIGPDETAGGHGVYKSTNGGMIWESKNAGLPTRSAVRYMSINPFDSKEIFIYIRPESGSSGIYKSPNAGDNWSAFFTDSYVISSLLFDEMDSTVRYAIGLNGTVHRWKNETYSAISSHGNFFQTGFPVATFLNSKTGSLFYVHNVYINNANIYRWTPKDSSWKSLLSNINATGDTIKTINSASINKGTIFISTDVGVFKSNDDGNNWLCIDHMQDMKFASDSSHIVGTGFSGTFFSADSGTNWMKAGGGPKINRVNAFSCISYGDSNSIYAITNTVVKSTDNGETWMGLQFPNNVIPSVILANPLNANIVYVGCGALYESNLGMYKSYDGGIHWQQIFSDGNIPVTAMDIDPNDTSRIIAGTPGELLQSTNSGLTWKSIMLIGDDTHYETNVVKISKSNPAKIYAGVSSNSIDRAGLVVTADSGKTWDFILSGSIGGITAIAIDPTNDDIVYLGNSSLVNKSTNGGKSWTPSGAVTGYVIDIEITPDNPNFLVATGRGEMVGEGGFINSTDGGATWNSVLCEGLSDDARTFAHIEPNGNFYEVYVGTQSYGLLKIEFPRNNSAVQEQRRYPSVADLSQNYPNPFNLTTIINYTIPKTSFVTLKVYDVVGKEITTLVNTEKSVGSYRFELNASQLTSGIYFYRLQTGNFVETKKFILLK